MKELSVVEKAKRYDEALKYAMIYYKNGDEGMKIMMKTCFPVLVEESEDEKIRSAIINEISLLEKECVIDEQKAVYKSWISWLEKQDVQQSVENEPFNIEHGKYYYCIKDYYSGGNKRASKGDVE